MFLANTKTCLKKYFVKINHIKTFTVNGKIEPVPLSYKFYEHTKSTEHPSGASFSPLIIMHGLFGSKSNWNSLCKAMVQKINPRRQLIAIDMRNHGDSPHTDIHFYPHMAEDVRHLLKQLKIKKVSILGHSMGGRAAMLFAVKYPELVDKLIVADISPISSSQSLSVMPAIMNALNEVSFLKNVTMSEARANIDKQLSEKFNDKSLRAFLLTNLIQKGDGSYGWRMNLNVLTKQFKEGIATFPDITNVKFEGSTLFIGGENSDYIPKEDLPHILKIFPNSKMVYIPGAGHFLHSEKPHEFLQIVTEFLNE